MGITATVENDTIKLPAGVHLPDGTRVRIDTLEERLLTGSELSELAGELAVSTDPSAARALKERIAAGFYGGQ